MLAPGSIIGNGYRVIGALDEGGMGAVYEVEQIATGARRALKVMHVQLVRDATLRERFAREARAGAAIQSDHVIQVLDAGVDEGTHMPYLVMERLEGVTLAARIARTGPLPTGEAVEILQQLFHALGAAHRAGIVHRDLKPENIFLAQTRMKNVAFMAKVLDFGIAKVLAETRRSVTAAMGTPAWMAPEQTLPSSQLGPQADVWSLGLLAFFMFTGRHYWPSANGESANTLAVMRDLAVGEIVPASVRAAEYGCAHLIPRGFDSWFAQCVNREPARRFPTAGDADRGFAERVGSNWAPVPPTSTPSLGRASVPSGPSFGQASAPSGPAFGQAPPPAHSDSVLDEMTRRPQMGAPSSTGPAATPGWSGRMSLRLALGLIGGVAGALVIVVTLFLRTTATAGAAASDASAGPEIVLRLHGSNTIGTELGPALAEAFLKKWTGAARVTRKRTAPDELLVETQPEAGGAVQAIEIHAHGSATAFQDLGASACDVGMASRRINAAEAEKLSGLGSMTSGACEHVIALDGLAVIVNTQNPVVSLSKDQITKLFSGELTNWSAVGGNDSSVSIHARDDKSGTYDTFKALVLGKTPLASSAIRYEESEKLSDQVAGDANAIGFIGLPYVRQAKALMVKDVGTVALLPSPLTVATEDYLLTRRLFLYTPAKPTEAARKFVNFAFSNEGQQLVHSAGFVNLRPECMARNALCDKCTPDYQRAIADACRLSLDFRFETGSKQLDNRAQRDLGRLVGLMNTSSFAGKSVLLFGFADKMGARADNVQLSQDRAQVVGAQLRAAGVSVAMVTGFGPDMPVADNATEEGRQKNRRVEAWLK